MSRQHFESTGKLRKCRNPLHEFSLGRLLVHCRFAEDAWCHMNDAGNLITTFAGVTTTETHNGHKLLAVTIWKLSIMFGLRARASEKENERG